MSPSTTPPPDDLVKLSMAARLLQCHPATVHKWIHTGKLPAWRRVGIWLVSKADCLALLEHKGKRAPVSVEQTPAFQRGVTEAMAKLRARGIG